MYILYEWLQMHKTYRVYICYIIFSCISSLRLRSGTAVSPPPVLYRCNSLIASVGDSSRALFLRTTVDPLRQILINYSLYICILSDGL